MSKLKVAEERRLADEALTEARGAPAPIPAAKKPRAGWAQVARERHAAVGGLLLDPPTSTAFDETEWQW